MQQISGLISKGATFFKDVEVEGKRVSWPNINETTKSTLAVLLISALLASFLGLVDFLFSLAVKFILS